MNKAAHEKTPGREARGFSLVEVLRRYSNRMDLVDPMIDVLRRIKEDDRTDEPGVCPTGRGGGLVPVRERLGEAGMAELLECRQAGATVVQLVDQFGIGRSSVKRILREARQE